MLPRLESGADSSMVGEASLIAPNLQHHSEEDEGKKISITNRNVKNKNTTCARARISISMFDNTRAMTYELYILL